MAITLDGTDGVTTTGLTSNGIDDNATSTAITIDSSGHAIIPAGVTLGTSVGVYSAANTLDDYEEGTWTPTLLGDGTNPSVTYSGDTGGFYIKIGRLVYLTGTIRTTAISGGSGALLVGGLPFSNSDRSQGDNSDGIGAARTNLWNGTATTLPTVVQAQRSEARAYIASGGYNQVSNILGVSNWGSTCMMSFTLVYYTS